MVNLPSRNVMVVADPTPQSAAALQYALSHALVERDKLILFHIENPNSWRNTISMLLRRPNHNAVSAPNFVPDGASNTETDFLDQMKRVCEIAQPKIDVRVEKTDMDGKDKATIILSKSKALGIDLIIIGQKRSLSSVILGVPTEFGFLSELPHLCLEANRLSGSPPAGFGQCSKLVYLNLSNNRYRRIAIRTCTFKQLENLKSFSQSALRLHSERIRSDVKLDSPLMYRIICWQALSPTAKTFEHNKGLWSKAMSRKYLGGSLAKMLANEESWIRKLAYVTEPNEKCDVYSFWVLALEVMMGEASRRSLLVSVATGINHQRCFPSQSVGSSASTFGKQGDRGSCLRSSRRS
ncbi:hypothetical protein V6N12_061595 [Hibiscus sabdariffa]|uniref:UspA domain-containing protein n=1 Tax=Hibiscus sabdariffa TaxID=183260 RepID=A0ABR2DXI7_9ROSI